jgi:hypothetical protein
MIYDIHVEWERRHFDAVKIWRKNCWKLWTFCKTSKWHYDLKISVSVDMIEKCRNIEFEKNWILKHMMKISRSQTMWKYYLNFFWNAKEKVAYSRNILEYFSMCYGKSCTRDVEHFWCSSDFVEILEKFLIIQYYIMGTVIRENMIKYWNGKGVKNETLSIRRHFQRK